MVKYTAEHTPELHSHQHCLMQLLAFIELLGSCFYFQNVLSFLITVSNAQTKQIVERNSYKIQAHSSLPFFPLKVPFCCFNTEEHIEYAGKALYFIAHY